MRYSDLIKEQQVELIQALSSGTPNTCATIEKIVRNLNPFVREGGLTGICWIAQDSYEEYLTCIILYNRN